MTIIPWLKDRFMNACDAPPECSAYEFGCIHESLDLGNDWRLANCSVIVP